MSDDDLPDPGDLEAWYQCSLRGRAMMAELFRVRGDPRGWPAAAFPRASARDLALTLYDEWRVSVIAFLAPPRQHTPLVFRASTLLS